MRRVCVEFPHLQGMESIVVGVVGGYNCNLESEFSLLCSEDRFVVLRLEDGMRNVLHFLNTILILNVLLNRLLSSSG